MRVAIYARTSKAEGDDETSIPVQLADCSDHAADEGWGVAGEYVDSGITGWARKDRPNYERMFADAEAGRFDAQTRRGRRATSSATPHESTNSWVNPPADAA